MKVRIKRIDKELPLPKYETSGAVAFDLSARIEVTIPPKSVERIPSNIVVEVPKGYVLFVKDRSSTAKRKNLIATAGVIDQDFCGDNDEILLQYYNFSDEPVIVEKGERIAQGMFLRVDMAEWDEVEEMGNKDRGSFGTTGHK
jgi:dUTP pyrophosphatase